MEPMSRTAYSPQHHELPASMLSYTYALQRCVNHLLSQPSAKHPGVGTNFLTPFFSITYVWRKNCNGDPYYAANS